MAHSRSRHLADLCRDCDIVVAAVGRAEMDRRDWITPGATLIDVGINRIQRGEAFILVGDVNFEEALEVAGAMTPIPGGVGPMTVPCLLDNTERLAADS